MNRKPEKAELRRQFRRLVNQRAATSEGRISEIRLVEIDAVNPSTYNPRVADPARLDLIELSLRKLGFLLPLYADSSGELSSGHQRHFVSKRMGIKFVPVCYFQREMSLTERKAINIMFNRGTNDMGITDTSGDLTEAIAASNVLELARSLPDKVLNSQSFYPCLQAKTTPLEPLLKTNTGRWVQYAANISGVMRRKGIVMPLVATPDLRVVNGIGRLEALAEAGEKTAQVVIISEAEAALADAMLNMLSMDFDLKNRFADYLRHNSFRRARVSQPGNLLGYGFTFVAHPQQHPNTFSLANPEHLRAWEREHGRTILDFGAGRLKETANLRRVGFDVDAFEPYRMGEGDQIDRDMSVRLNREFLQVIATGKEYSSIFLSAVLNSVPFYEDRVHVVRILAALATEQTRVYASANADTHNYWRNFKGRGALDRTTGRTHGFVLDYEPGMKLGDLAGGSPKAQKYHSLEEFRDLFNLFFQNVECGYYMRQVVTAIASRPRPVEPAALRQSLEFEFNLPYPDGSRMGLGAEAVAAFSQRLGIAL